MEGDGPQIVSRNHLQLEVAGVAGIWVFQDLLDELSGIVGELAEVVDNVRTPCLVLVAVYLPAPEELVAVVHQPFEALEPDILQPGEEFPCVLVGMLSRGGRRRRGHGQR